MELPLKLVIQHVPGRVVYTLLDANGTPQGAETVLWNAPVEAHDYARQQLLEKKDRVHVENSQPH